MNVVRLASDTDFAGWRDAARRLARSGVRAEDVEWIAGPAESLFESVAIVESTDYSTDEPARLPSHVPAQAPAVLTQSPRVPSAFITLARDVILHRDPQRFALLYRMLTRLQDEPRLLQIATDADVSRAHFMQKAVDRDIHKMHAFVRFREAAMDDGPVYIAWFEPSHRIVEAAAPFFVRRFASMRWSILTPERCAYWDGETLRFGPGATKSQAPGDDALEAYWRTYYASIFNPARLKIGSMQAHMPKKYWRNLPEAALIPGLIGESGERMQQMIDADAANPLRKVVPYAVATTAQPAAGTLAELRALAKDCRNCALWEHATQTVFGEGPAPAPVMFVGEQPGDQEDLAGRPFVGPSGRLFEAALAASGIARDGVYVTNAVKHFKFEPRGKWRLHRTPRQVEIDACVEWFERELDLIRPKLVVCMGATALRAVTGLSAPVSDLRGRIIPWRDGVDLLVTVHPAAILRGDSDVQDRETGRFNADIGLASPYANTHGEPAASPAH